MGTRTHRVAVWLVALAAVGAAGTKVDDVEAALKNGGKGLLNAAGALVKDERARTKGEDLLTLCWRLAPGKVVEFAPITHVAAGRLDGLLRRRPTAETDTHGMVCPHPLVTAGDYEVAIGAVEVQRGVVYGLSRIDDDETRAADFSGRLDKLSNRHPHTLAGHGAEKHPVAVPLHITGDALVDQFFSCGPLPQNGLAKRDGRQ